VRRGILIVLSCGLLLAAAGCGSGGVVTRTPKTVVGTIAAPPTARATPPLKLKGPPTAGKAIFEKAGCTSCHTLKDAGSTGTVGPNLDQAKPELALVVKRVTQGAGAMPSFKGQLSDKQIADVAAYVVKATGGNANG